MRYVDEDVADEAEALRLTLQRGLDYRDESCALNTNVVFKCNGMVSLGVASGMAWLRRLLAPAPRWRACGHRREERCRAVVAATGWLFAAAPGLSARMRQCGRVL